MSDGISCSKVDISGNGYECLCNYLFNLRKSVTHLTLPSSFGIKNEGDAHRDCLSSLSTPISHNL